MLKYRWHAAWFIPLILLLGGSLWALYRPTPHAQLQQLQLADGSQLLTAKSAAPTATQVLLVLETAQLLQANELVALADSTHAQIAQIELPLADCARQSQRLLDASQALGGNLDLVAGIGPAATLAWRWLAVQNSDSARALSIDFSLQQPDCAAALPEKAAHGHWSIAWNNNPDDPSARFARQQLNADTQISAYDVSLKQLLQSQLQHLLQGQQPSMPIVEVAAAQPSDSVALFYSGDGGWRDLDRDLSNELAQRGLPVVGIDALRYFWQHKSSQQGAADLNQLMQTYQQKWASQRFILIGYSFGADVLPAFYNQLPASAQQQIAALVLLAPGRSGSFEIEVKGWLGQTGGEAPTGPELLKLPASKVLCVYGSEERLESACTLPGAPGEALQLPGGHHFDQNYSALADKVLKSIQQRLMH
jgi:type IV secretory pathway VirJ component